MEQLLTHPIKDADKIQQLFVKVSSDLSYARSFYPNRSVRTYLNDLTQRAYNEFVRKEKQSVFVAISDFFKTILPAEIYHSRKQLFLSFLVFSLAVFIGALSSKHNPGFTALIIGDDYVAMTEANINDGDPMRVYKDEDAAGMFFGITINNIRVAMLAFALGFFGSVFTYLVLVFNGIMLGTFQYFFYNKGLFATSFLTIWIHGTIEISAIIIAGAAGIVMGNGLLFPGTYSRKKSLQISAKRGLRIFMGTVPLFIIAGLFESFLTRHTEFPALLKLGIIILSLVFILFLFVYYPYIAHKRGLRYSSVSISPSIEENRTYTKMALRSLGNNLSTAIWLYGIQVFKYLRFGGIPVLLFITLMFAWQIPAQHEGASRLLDDYALFSFTYGQYVWFLLLTISVNYLLHVLAAVHYQNVGGILALFTRIRSQFFITLPFTAFVISAFYFFDGWLQFLASLIASPPFLFILFDQIAEEKTINGMQVLNLYKRNFGYYLSYLPAAGILVVLLALIFFFSASLSNLIVTEYFTWHQVFDQHFVEVSFIFHFLCSSIFIVFLPLAYYFTLNIYYSEFCKKEAFDLKEWHKSFGKETAEHF